MKKVIIVLVLLSGSFCFSIDCHWIGESGDWSDTENWKNSKIPKLNDRAIFSGEKAKKITIKSKPSIKSFIVKPDSKAKFHLKSDLSVREDIVLEGGVLYAGKNIITVGRNFISGEKNFSASTSTLILKGNGSLKGYRFNHLILGFQNKTITLEQTIYPTGLELKGGIFEGKGGIKFYNANPLLKGVGTSTLNISYISFRPSKGGTYELPEIKTGGNVYLESYKAKVTFLITKHLSSKKRISVYGDKGGFVTLELKGGKISAKSINVGIKNQDRSGELKIVSGKFNLKDGIYINNKTSSLDHPAKFKLPKVHKY